MESRCSIYLELSRADGLYQMLQACWGVGPLPAHRGVVSWPTTWEDINSKRAPPYYNYCSNMGQSLEGPMYPFLSDNAAVVAAIKARSAHHITLYHLIK